MTESTPWGDAPAGFCACPPACLVLLEDREAGGVEKARKAFIDEARELQRRLMEELLQVNTEVGVFLRLMYKNKNQHRRSLYYRRLSEVKRDLQMLGTSGLQETVEAFTILCTAPRTDWPPSKATPQSKLAKEEINERAALCNLLGVARLLNQIDGPILAAGVHIAGLLAQSFFVPFALTIFSSLARFRVLLAQVLYDVITAFNLLSATLELRRPGSFGVLWRGFPVQLECTWDGIKLCITEKKLSAKTESKGKQSDELAEPAALWFVDDRTGATYDLPVLTNPESAGQQQHVNSGKPINANRDTSIGEEMEKVASTVPVLEDASVKARQSGVTGEIGESLPSSLDVDHQEKHLNVASDLPLMATKIVSGMGVTFKTKESPSPGLEGTAEDSNTRLSSSLPGVPTRSSVSYISISHKFVVDFATKGRMGQSVLPKNVNVGGMVKGEIQMAELENNKDIASEVDPRSRKDSQKGCPLDINVLEDSAPGIPSILPPLPLCFRSTKKTEIDTSKHDLEDVEMQERNAFIPQTLLEGPAVKLVRLNEDDKAKQALARPDCGGGGMSTVYAVRSFATMSTSKSLEVSVQLPVDEDNICMIQRANDELRTTLDSNTCSLDCLLDKQGRGPTSTLQQDDTESRKFTTLEECELQQGTIQSSLSVAVDEVCVNNLVQNGPRHTARTKKAESPYVHPLETISGGTTEANHSVVSKVELEGGAHQSTENAKEKQSIQDGPVTPDLGLPIIVNRSVVSSLELAGDIEARPVSSGVQNSGDALHQSLGLSTVNGMSVKGPLPKRPVAYASINAGLISISGAIDKTVSKDDSDGGLKHMGNVPKNVLEHAAKQNLGKHARASTPTKSKKSKGGVKGHVMLPSKDPDEKTPKRRKEADSRPALIKEKVVSEGVQQSTEIKDTPAKLKRERGKDEKEDKVRKKKVDDIFAMLLGGSG